ncbi:EF-P 5-aminopentanol modification-associated protein YfmF [Alkaliphilus serpentinus]|nr:pitrilysin family protein [Alkaliphilus serpentinus]
MELISEKILKGTHLHTITVDKFKTNSLNIYFQQPLVPQEVTYNALLPMIMQRGCQEYKDARLIAKELEYLYGANLIGDISKKGEKHIILFTLTTIALDYLEEPKLMDSALNLMKEVLFRPLIDEGGFDKDYFNQEVSNLESKIKGRVNNKNQYALDRCIEEMCRDENYRLYEYGRLEDLKAINPMKLYNHYEKIINNSPIDIVMVGSMKHQEAKDYIIKKLHLKDRNIEGVSFPEMIAAKEDLNEVSEDMDISQGKLILGYRTQISYQAPLYPALLLYSSILGGGAHSKLFLKVREERSLCYYIYSKVDKFKSIMLISCGIDVAKAEETKAVIADELNEMRLGNITQEEIDNGKEAIITAIQALGDNSNSLAEYTYSQIVGDFYLSPEELANKIRAVSLNDILEVASSIKLDTTYLLGTSKN